MTQEIAQFVERIAQITPAQWLPICDRFVASQFAASAAEVAAGAIAGVDLHISDAERRNRVRRVQPAYHLVANAVASVPHEFSRGDERIPLQGLAEVAALGAVQGILAREELRKRPNGDHIFNVLQSPFEGIVEVGA